MSVCKKCSVSKKLESVLDDEESVTTPLSPVAIGRQLQGAEVRSNITCRDGAFLDRMVEIGSGFRNVLDDEDDEQNRKRKFDDEHHRDDSQQHQSGP